MTLEMSNKPTDILAQWSPLEESLAGEPGRVFHPF